VREFLEWHADTSGAAEFGHWWWRERATGELVGMAGLLRDQVEDEPVVEVGWSIARACQRRGFATEAAVASIAWGFDACGLERIVSFSLPENLASRRVMERAGLKYERDFERKGFPHVLYIAHRETWTRPVSSALMLTVGQPAPDFTLSDQEGNQVTLSKLRGQTVVLYFYPRADTPGCTTQACGIRDRRADYEAAGARVLGVSPDQVDAVAKFAGKFSLDFTLLADPEHAVAEAYGTWAEKSMYGKKYWGVVRATFIIDADGEIVRVFPKVSPKTHDDEVLAALAELAA
jgi:peroxiredoxin Q/BCP